jgi:hypothetical protein
MSAAAGRGRNQYVAFTAYFLPGSDLYRGRAGERGIEPGLGGWVKHAGSLAQWFSKTANQQYALILASDR